MADIAAAPTFKKRSKKDINIRKRPATPPPEDSASDSDYTSDESGTRVKRRRKEGITVNGATTRAAQDLSKSTTFEADRSTVIASNEDATKTSNWYTDAPKVKSQHSKTRHERPEDGDNGTYKGKQGYSSYIEKSVDAPSKQIGPTKAPTNVRTITVTDFAPDVCKDYKQTGFCGFGDSCKFLHAREDYAQGWKLDREWEKAGKKTKKVSSNNAQEGLDGEEKMLQNIPFACILCKEPYKMPVVTQCGHYFCEKCAMTRYMKEKKRTCANCGADTNGTFNVARKLKDLLERKRKREAERQAGTDEAEADAPGL